MPAGRKCRRYWKGATVADQFDAIAEHQRLADEERSAGEALGRAAAEVRRLEMQMRRKDDERIEEYAKKARNQPHDIERVEAERADLLRELDVTTAEQEGAARAKARAEGEREALYLSHFEAFAEAAEPFSEQALKTFAELEEAYGRAVAAWAQARAAWSPLRPAIRLGIKESQFREGVVTGDEYADSDVPPFPLDSSELHARFVREQFAAVRRGSLAPRPQLFGSSPSPRRAKTTPRNLVKWSGQQIAPALVEQPGARHQEVTLMHAQAYSLHPEVMSWPA